MISVQGWKEGKRRVTGVVWWLGKCWAGSASWVGLAYWKRLPRSGGHEPGMFARGAGKEADGGDTTRSTGADTPARGDDRRPSVHGFSGRLAAFLDPGGQPDRGDVQPRARFRRLERRRLAGDQRGGPARRAAAGDGACRPVRARPTLTMICNIHDPITHQDYTRDPRNIARKAIQYMRRPGVADVCSIAPELEFFVFDDVRFDERGNEAFYRVDSVEGAWNRGRSESPNLGYKPGSGLGYFPCPPTDSLSDLRTEMAQIMAECGITTVGSPPRGGHGRPVRDRPDAAVAGGRRRPCDAGQVRHPQRGPTRGQDGQLHAQAALRRQRLGASHPSRPSGRIDTPLLSGSSYAGLSELGMHAIGGLLRHARALCAFGNPTTNSYKRLVPGFEAPTKLSYSRGNRAAIIRIPVYNPSPDSQRIEYRCPDSAANPYLLFSAMLMAAHRRHPDPGDAGRPARQGHLRPRAGRAGPRALDPALAGGVAGAPCGRITSSCSRAMSSRRTSSTRGSGTSRPTRSRPCASGRIRTSSRSITTCEALRARVG